MLDGCCRLARGHERLHEAERGVGAKRIERSEPAPPVGRGTVVAAAGGFFRQGYERVAELVCESRALGVNPALKLRRPFDEEPVEERSRIRTDGRFRIAASQCSLERL